MGELLFEIVLQLLLEIVGELFLGPLVKYLNARLTWTGLAVALVAFGAGFTLGWTSAVLYPHRLAPGVPVTGVSLLLAPLITATVMSGAGRWRYGPDRQPPGLFSFWNAFAFALGVALARLLRLT